MPQKYQNKYRIKSSRLEGYDYSQSGLYFITICTDIHEHYFGGIVDGIMQLSEIGIIANDEWHEFSNHRDNVNTHEFVVMPNHIHGIIEIVDIDNTRNGRDDARIVSTKSLQKPIDLQMKKISPKPGSLGRIVGAYKSAVSKFAHRAGYEFNWQSRYYDHIIRDYKSYNRISEYIKNNPENWKEDRFNNINE